MKPGLLSGDRTWFLFARWAVVNLLGLCFMILAWQAGWIARVLASDTLYISRMIMALFCAGLAVTFFRAIQVSRELNIVRSFMVGLATDASAAIIWLRDTRSRSAILIGDYAAAQPEDRATIVNVINETIGVKTTFVPFVAASLTMLGLIGTVVGAKLAFDVIDPNIVGDAAKAVPMISEIIAALAIAVDTTIVGALSWVWLMWANLPIRQASAQLASEIKRAGVYHVRQQ